MNPPKYPNPLSGFILGVIDGLLVGLIAEEVRISYVNYEMGRAAREYLHSGMNVDFIEAQRQTLVPLICIVASGVVGYLVYRHFMNRPRVLLLLWPALGAVAIWAGYFMSTSSPTIFSFIWILIFAIVSYAVHRLWSTRPDSLFLLWPVIGISALLVVAMGVQLVGLLFYWPELRNPLIWLLALLGIVATNMIYGALVQFIFDRFSGRTMKHAT